MPAAAAEAESMRARMMERSERRIESAAQHDDGPAQQAAHRVLENAQSWRDWTATHNRLVTSITLKRTAANQAREVKRMALSMIHRKAPFEFLREEGVRGPERREIFETLFGCTDYARVLVSEHRNYVNSVCSYLCIDNFCGSTSMRHIHAYERAYNQFWRAQARAQVRTLRARASKGADLVEYLRDEAMHVRKRILDTAPSAADKFTIEELRRPTGDTVRIRPFV